MFGLVDKGFLAAGVAAPEEEDEMRADVIEVFDDGFGENFPAVATVGAGSVGFDRENIIKEEDALALPVFEVAGGVLMAADISIDFFVNVDERRWNGSSAGDGKSQSVSSTGSMIRVLAEDDDGNLVEVGSEGIEDELFGWEDGFGLIFLVEKGAEFSKIRFGKFRL